MEKRIDRGRIIDALVCALASAVLLTLCSMCSPRYPLNIWDDANCLMTVGRAMKHGAVLYRDIYEQKGPLLYLIHMLAACVTEESFFGVFLFEIASLTVTLMGACRIIAIRSYECIARAGAVLFGACVLVSRSFSRGDSAEEFCLPFLMTALCILLEAHEHNDKPLWLGEMLLCGVMAGCVATIKYTALGLFVGLCIAQALCCARYGGLPRLLASAGAFLAGMLLPILPWLVYFGAHDALGDAYTAYIYNNIFLYHAGERTNALLAMLEAGWRNAPWAIPAVYGVLRVLKPSVPTDDRVQESYWVSEHVGRTQIADVLATAICALIPVFFLGKVYPYYPLVLCVFATLGFREVGESMTLLGGWPDVLAAIIIALSVGVASSCCPNAFLRGVPLDLTAQGRLAARMEPGASLLQYSHLDDGLYLISGALPQEKFFVLLNVDYAPMRQALDDAVRERRPDYVLISWRELPEAFDGYELVASEVGYDDENNRVKDLYLYGRKAE